MHFQGSRAVLSAIINKAGLLNDEERAVMERYTIEGERWSAR